MEMKCILGDAGETNVEKTAGPVAPTEPAELPVNPKGGVEDDRVTTLPKTLGVWYSQQGWYQP